jgi:sec-independent protein translocase protein TatA
MGALQPGHLVVILLVVLIVFGPGKMSSIGSDMGKALREFRKATESPNDSESPKPLAASNAQTAATRMCGSCAATNATGAAFCANCGARLAQTVDA